MVDIATLGIQLDSRPVTTATTALNALAAAARPAETATNTLAKASAGAATAHAGLSTQAMAASHSVRSLIESLALGMPPTTALLAQMNHLSYAASGPGGLAGAVKEAGGAFVGILTPARVALAGVTGLGAGFAIAAAHVSQSMLTLETLSNRSGVDMSRLFQLQGVAGREGIGTEAFQKGLQRISELTRDAQHSAGPLLDLFRANGVAVGGVAQNLSKVADLIKNAANDEERYQLLQQLGLPATRQWLDFLTQGGASLNAAADKLGGLNENARAVADRWKEIGQATNEWKVYLEDIGTNSILKILQGLGGISSYVRSLGQDSNFRGWPSAGNSSAEDQLKKWALANPSRLTFGDMIPQAAPAGASKPTQNPDDLRRTIGLEMPRLGLLGQTATVREGAVTAPIATRIEIDAAKALIFQCPNKAKVREIENDRTDCRDAA